MQQRGIRRVWGMLLVLLVLPSWAQGQVRIELRSREDSTVVRVATCRVQGTGIFRRFDDNGRLVLPEITTTVVCEIKGAGFQAYKGEFGPQKNGEYVLVYLEPTYDSKVVHIYGSTEASTGIGRQDGVDGTTLYEGKKNELILLGQTDANLATNNTRQVFARVPGVNIIENDGAGVQIGLATRGLNPNRIAEFNVRQNGYDISADALGYPENYYTPPLQAVERIEIIRGAAGLQFGPQFGGLINYVMHKPDTLAKFAIHSSITGGSFGYMSTFHRLNLGTKKHSTQVMLQYKQSDGWRNNSEIDYYFAQIAHNYRINHRWQAVLELTAMNYVLRQAGGLTMKQFKEDPRQATRDRNWLKAQWLIPALHIKANFKDSSTFDVRLFGTIASRGSLGNLIIPPQLDYRPNRTLLYDDYLNFGLESRYGRPYKIAGIKSYALGGIRLYRGMTHRVQGFGTDGSGPDFSFINPNDVENSDFRFPGTNAAVFVENILYINKKLSITPGFRLEYIRTQAEGYYKTDFDRIEDTKDNPRSFPLFGIGVSYKVQEGMQTYGNISQNFSGVNFNDIRVNNPTLVVDSNIKDVNGYTVDLGIRGELGEVLNYDLGVFYLSYNDRIGTIIKADNNFNIYRVRTNIADSRSFGAELFAEWDVSKTIDKKTRHHFFLFTTSSFNDARYVRTPFRAVLNKFVEYAPQFTGRGGISYRFNNWSASVQFTHVSDQFSDATNTANPQEVNPVNGIIPAYTLMDMSAKYVYKAFEFGISLNNITDAAYFTRRADGYPGPGIIPSDGRSLFISIDYKFRQLRASVGGGKSEER